MLPHTFYKQNTCDVAKKLLGQRLHIGRNWGWITETEAYLGENDPASHAYNGLTKRNAPMYLEGGHIYIYLIYGMHYCLNIVTENEGFPSAVLIRGMYFDDINYHATGPGKLTKHLNINSTLNGKLLSKANTIWVDQGHKNTTHHQQSRIGIKRGLEHQWRYTMINKSF